MQVVSADDLLQLNRPTRRVSLPHSVRKCCLFCLVKLNDMHHHTGSSIHPPAAIYLLVDHCVLRDSAARV